MSATARKPDDPPESAREALWRLAWRHLPPWLRWGLVLVVLVVGAGFAVWSSLPSSAQERILASLSASPARAGFWRVEASLVTGEKVAPGALLELSVECDHDGYVWVFTAENGQGVLLYPQSEDLTARRHRVEAGEPRPVPAAADAFGLQAGLETGRESLIVIVTDRAQASVGWARLAELRPDLTVRAAPLATGAWGAAQLHYEVEG